MPPCKEAALLMLTPSSGGGPVAFVHLSSGCFRVVYPLRLAIPFMPSPPSPGCGRRIQHIDIDMYHMFCDRPSHAHCLARCRHERTPLSTGPLARPEPQAAVCAVIIPHTGRAQAHVCSHGAPPQPHLHLARPAASEIGIPPAASDTVARPRATQPAVLPGR